MVGIRACTARTQSGDRCGATPLRDADVCFWHSPEHAEEATEARRLGGMRRKRERTVAGAYDVAGLASVADIRRIIEIVVFDTLSLDNSVARGRLLITASMAAARLLEVGELEARLGQVEAALGPRLKNGR
jgi:hypothetical protein